MKIARDGTDREIYSKQIQFDNEELHNIIFIDNIQGEYSVRFDSTSQCKREKQQNNQMFRIIKYNFKNFRPT